MCLAAAREIVASAKGTVVSSIEVVSNGVLRHQRLPSGRAALWHRLTERGTSCANTGRLISCDQVRTLDYDAFGRDLNPHGTPRVAQTIFTPGVPLIQEDEEVHCPAMPTVIDWDRRHRPKNEHRGWATLNAAVARPIMRAEFETMPMAKKAMDAEVLKLQTRGVWPVDSRTLEQGSG